MDLKDVWQALTDRLRDPFLFAFTVLTVGHNWPAFYVVLRPEGFNREVINNAIGAWRGWCTPIVGAFVYTLLYPGLQVVFVAARTAWHTLEQSWKRKLELGVGIPFSEVTKHGLYKSAHEQRNALRQYLNTAWQGFDVEKTGYSLVHVYDNPGKLEPPQFLIRPLGNQDALQRIRKVPKSPDDGLLVFAFAAIDNNTVMGAMDQGLVLWPPKYPDAKVLGMHAESFEVVPHTEPSAIEAYTVWVERLPGDRQHLGRFKARNP